MRLWLTDSERRPDPAPVATDDRTAFLVGLGLWLIALVVVVVMLPTLTASGETRWLWTCIAGIGIGLLGLIYTHLRQKR